TDHDDGSLRRYTVDIAVLQSPENVLRPVTAESQIDCIAMPIVSLPDLNPGGFPALRDGITDKDQVDIALGNLRVFVFLANFPPFLTIAMGGLQRCTGLSASRETNGQCGQAETEDPRGTP